MGRREEDCRQDGQVEQVSASRAQPPWCSGTTLRADLAGPLKP